ncbi:MAG: LLM class flavin-dependent oxidoreductase [SAR202 cluster bacterium]|nr:MAG: LLM class flavin-dependent oxidoreductase [SAR202 cluster bacterium]
MDANLTLSVVDQSPMREGGNSGDALRETIELAVAVERMGYSRYWVAEHHNLPNFAGTSPEMLIGQIAARTQTIRVGSGGVMLSHYSALKVAENFRFLDSLYPDRIDLGIGRAPGSDQLTMSALAYPAYPKGIEHFPRQVSDVVGYLSGSLQDGHPFADVSASPGEATTVPQIWLLGSRYESAYMAAQMGLSFAYAHFFGTGAQDGPDIVEGYRKNFQPSEYLAEPQVNVGVHVVCADTEEEALNIAASRNLARLFSVTGRAKGIPSVEDARNYQYLTDEEVFVQQYGRNCVDGDPDQVKAKLMSISERYETTDLSIVTICHSYQDRVKSYELVADAFDLS